MTCIIQHNNNNTTIANICSEFAKDEGVGDALVVENDNVPRDAQLAYLIRLDQLRGSLFHRTTLQISLSYKQ